MDLFNILFLGVQGFIIAFYLEKYLELKAKHADKWQKLQFLPLATALLCAIHQIFDCKFIDEYFYFILFVFLFIFLYDIKDSRNVKNVFWLIGPFTLLKFFQIMSEILMTDSKTQSDLTDGLTTFLVFWIIGFGIYLSRQNKKDKIQRLKDETERMALERQKNSLENLVALRTNEIMEQKIVLEKSMEELQATQTQLIHSEKMASLGELTAGIAHEIQNPLNFVNNFAELNTELIDELKQEQGKPERNYENEAQIIEDINQNLLKIIHHGKRADGIIKGMLQHSRKSTGQKEEIDINALAEEYLKLAYHGLRAKDKSFNAQMETDLDPNMGKVMAIPQDIGRVFLNIITNAFYVVNEKKKLELQTNEMQDYHPLVKVTTKRSATNITIAIKDNGNGIPEKIRDKIFQPFFTTKPTGQGTGLGLSMSYEIITKGHNGEIEVESKENIGTNFIITIPIIL